MQPMITSNHSVTDCTPAQTEHRRTMRSNVRATGTKHYWYKGTGTKQVERYSARDQKENSLSLIGVHMRDSC